jgi:hypothetical protein
VGNSVRSQSEHQRQRQSRQAEILHHSRITRQQFVGWHIVPALEHALRYAVQRGLRRRNPNHRLTGSLLDTADNPAAILVFPDERLR